MVRIPFTVAESLLRQGREAEALDLAESMMEDWNSWGVHDIARFCESILVRQGRFDDAYRRYGLRYASGNTYLAMWRDLADRYPGFDPRGILEDLMQVKGSPGQVVLLLPKSAGLLDIALECAADHDAAPANTDPRSEGFQIEGACLRCPSGYARDWASCGRARIRSSPAGRRRSSWPSDGGKREDGSNGLGA